MNRVVQISVIGRLSGNVNADGTIGQRITLKKMYSSSGEVLPFVSARAVKYSIRQALENLGHKIDPFITGGEGRLRMADSGRPDLYIDNDLFGFMVTKGDEVARKRQAPIALSYFKALKDTPIKAEFAARFPRLPGEAPGPFEVEVADFIGRLNCIIYDNIGVFKKDEVEGGATIKLNDDVRKKRLEDFLRVFLTPSYVLPRRTNSLNIPEYIGALILLSERGPLPIYQYHDYNFDRNKIDESKLQNLEKLYELYHEERESKDVASDLRFMYIDYMGAGLKLPAIIECKTIAEAIKCITQFLISTGTGS